MGYLQLASVIGASGSGIGAETGPLCVVCFALGLCALGAALRLLWKSSHHHHQPRRPAPRAEALAEAAREESR